MEDIDEGSLNTGQPLPLSWSTEKTHRVIRLGAKAHMLELADPRLLSSTELQHWRDVT